VEEIKTRLEGLEIQLDNVKDMLEKDDGDGTHKSLEYPEFTQTN
jgi:hypothetical protein